MPKAFVTGATGYIGGRLIHAMADTEDFSAIHCLVRHPEWAEIDASQGVEIFQGDIIDKDSIRAAMQGCDVVFHLAAWYELGIHRSVVPEMERINIGGTRNVLEVARDLDVTRTIYVSTAYAIGRTGSQIADETFAHCGQFTCEYERTKLEAHRLAEQFSIEGLPLVTILPGAVYGEEDPSLLGDTFKRLIEGNFPALISGTERSTLTYVHVDDVVQGIVQALNRGRLGESYLLASEVMSFEDMIACVTELAGSDPPRMKIPLWLARAMAVVDEGFARLRGTRPLISQESLNSLVCSFAVSSEKARKELGFSPRSNREGFEQTIRWIKKQSKA